ncbi:MAG: NAD(P)H-dependent oxidoreductase [Deltaproteobacteria bacterium]|nr:NAD(P)H-dependent oxidoreductase [Deltaproteobacteria bacterium]
MQHALLLFGHPETDSFNGRLAARYVAGYRAAGGTIDRIDLAELDFDPLLRSGYRVAQPLEPDLERLRSAIERADRLVWVFPTWWAAPPALVRAVVERVFVPGWAFRYEEGRALPRGLLAGRSARVIVTMDSPGWWYTAMNHRAVHRSFGTATLSFCGLAPVEFTTIHGVREMTEARREAWCERVSAQAAVDAHARPRPPLRLPAATESGASPEDHVASGAPGERRSEALASYATRR